MIRFTEFYASAVRSVLALSAAVFIAFFACVANAAADQSAVARSRATVAELHETLLSVMKGADALGFEGRRELLAPVIVQTFDLPYISRLVTGQHWKGLTDEEREKMVDVFGRLTVATYAARFDGYSGQLFETMSDAELKRGNVLVRSELRGTDGDVVQFDYVLHEDAGSWRIVNVVANGVSDLSVKRAEYSSIISESGFDALVTRLNTQVSDLQSGARG